MLSVMRAARLVALGLRVQLALGARGRPSLTTLRGSAACGRRRANTARRGMRRMRSHGSVQRVGRGRGFFAARRLRFGRGVGVVDHQAPSGLGEHVDVGREDRRDRRVLARRRRPARPRCAPRAPGPSKARCSVVRTRSCAPPAKICAQLSRTASKPTRRGPCGWMHTMSSLSAHTAIIAARSPRSNAS